MQDNDFETEAPTTELVLTEQDAYKHALASESARSQRERNAAREVR